MIRLALVFILIALPLAAFAGWRAFRGWEPDPDRYPVRGIDVSHHQGAIDWTAVAADDVAFAYLKASEGGDHRDRRFAANWRAAFALLDQGEQLPDTLAGRERDSLFARAEMLARRALAADSLGPEGHFAVAATVGRASLTMGKKERIRRAKIIRDEALRTLALDPSHDGAYHVLGRWNAEIMRLSGLSRFFSPF